MSSSQKFHLNPFGPTLTRPWLGSGDAVMLLPAASLLAQHRIPGTHALSNGVVFAASMTTWLHPGLILKGKHITWLRGNVYV